MKNLIYRALLLAALLTPTLTAEAQGTYTQAPVSISKDRVRGSDGNVYYSHVVLERQTLYALSKAYGVSVEDICKANPTLDLEKEGLKKGQIILIPTTGTAYSGDTGGATSSDKAKDGASSASTAPASAAETNSADFITHTVKWYEDIDMIARKYGCTASVIMQVNGMSDGKVRKGMKLRIPKDPSAYAETTSTAQEGDSATESTQEEEATEPQDEKEDSSSVFGGIFDWLSPNKERKDLKATLLLPFNAKGKAETMYMDFYAGVLLAVNDLKEADGIDTELSVYDVANGAMPVTEERLEESDVVIGPISSADLTRTLEACPQATTVISPLEPKAEGLTADHANLIHAPAPASAQYADLMDWLREDMEGGDRLIVFTEKGAKLSTSMTQLSSALQASGLTYSTINYGILEGRRISSSMSSSFTKSGTNRVLVISESEAFVTDVVRNLGLMLNSQFSVVLYAPARIRSFDTIGVENFHAASMHVACSYYIDYCEPEVDSFVMRYRALFGAEPTQFAFQGYDTATYFLTAALKYGKDWRRFLEDYDVEGLQSSFDFTKGSPQVNTATRRIVYNADYSVTLL